MATTDDRAVGALEDVLAIERGDAGTGMVRVVTMSDCYIVDVRKERCECPDWEYHLEGDGRCKHIWAALDATGQIDAGVHELVDDLEARREPVIATDGGQDKNPIRLVGQEWEISVSETRSLGDYENIEPSVSVSGTIPADVGQLDPDGRKALKALLLATHKEIQEVVERAADNRQADEEDWGVRSEDE